MLTQRRVIFRNGDIFSQKLCINFSIQSTIHLIFVTKNQHRMPAIRSKWFVIRSLTIVPHVTGYPAMRPVAAATGPCSIHLHKFAIWISLTNTNTSLKCLPSHRLMLVKRPNRQQYTPSSSTSARTATLPSVSPSEARSTCGHTKEIRYQHRFEFPEVRISSPSNVFEDSGRSLRLKPETRESRERG